MADVDKCVRICEEALCEENSAVAALEILKLPNNQKIRVLREKSKEEITDFLERCKIFIKAQIVHTFYPNAPTDIKNVKLSPTSNNNKEGADVFHILPDNKRVEIEVKFGAKTDKAIGMDVFEKIFGTNIFKQTLSTATRKKWKEFYISENYNDKNQFGRLFESLNDGIEKFNGYVEDEKKGFLTPEEQTYMEQEIINNSGAGKIKADYYMKFSFESANLKEIKTIKTGIGKWKILKVEKIDDANGAVRVNVFTENSTTGVGVKYTLNWKNDYKIDSNKGKVSAKLGFGSPSWNVWVNKKTSDL